MILIKLRYISTLVLILSLILIISLFIGSIKSLYNISIKSINKDKVCLLSETPYYKILYYCKDPYIAKCISETKYPYTLAAIAKVESDYRPQIVGDKGASHGLLQIQRKWYGDIPDSVSAQCAKGESIFDGHYRRHSYRDAISKYNGTGKPSRVYADKVLKAKREIILCLKS